MLLVLEFGDLASGHVYRGGGVVPVEHFAEVPLEWAHGLVALGADGESGFIKMEGGMARVMEFLLILSEITEGLIELGGKFWLVFRDSECENARVRLAC